MAVRTPSGEEVHAALYDPHLRWSMLRARWAYVVRESFTARLVRPVEDRLFERWLKQDPPGHQIEAMGLPYRSVSAYLGPALELHVDPQHLVQSLSMKASFPGKRERSRAASAFIWKGDWDLARYDFREGSRYVFIQDIWQHRLDLSRSDAYRQLLQRLEAGKPFRSHQKGILLNTPDKILAYLQIYIGYMESMAGQGFDKGLGKDPLGVVIGRHGDILKVNRGLHRLAMAQVLGLDDIVVRVRAVHELWWESVTQGEYGEPALKRMVQALSECRPAS
ncbi:hypothetical protein GCM10027040_24130 [Halomonas shantousis]